MIDNRNIFVLLSLLLTSMLTAQTGQPLTSRMINVGEGWAGNSVNAVVFRKNAITSLNGFQFISYYDQHGNVIIGKRALNDSTWVIKKTQYKGTVTDAHRSISIALDGQGYLHMAWDHHGNRLRYCRSIQPFSLEMGAEVPMIGHLEEKVTYPEFYRMPDGRLLFFYRDGSSGNGNLVINIYSPADQQWARIQDNLINGEGQRNAYWQACVDANGYIHVSWVWRESPDVASNHDLCYAVSKDGGRSWEKSTGERYNIPITQAGAELICRIPQKSELINQTSMYAGSKGQVFIATYHNGIGGVPQYQLVYNTGRKWEKTDLGFRTNDFSLSGQGTKKIPVSRPQVIAWNKGKKQYAALIFRDQERGSVVSIATSLIKKKFNWKLYDLPAGPVGEWEPIYDTDRWKEQRQLHLFIQPVTQADAEAVVKAVPTLVKLLECHF